MTDFWFICIPIPGWDRYILICVYIIIQFGVTSYGTEHRRWGSSVVVHNWLSSQVPDKSYGQVTRVKRVFLFISHTLVLPLLRENSPFWLRPHQSKIWPFLKIPDVFPTSLGGFDDFLVSVVTSQNGSINLITVYWKLVRRTVLYFSLINSKLLLRSNFSNFSGILPEIIFRNSLKLLFEKEYCTQHQKWCNRVLRNEIRFGPDKKRFRFDRGERSFKSPCAVRSKYLLRVRPARWI